MKQELRREWECLKALREDAVERGMMELAIVYGWSTLRLGEALVTLAALGPAHAREVLSRRP